MPSEPLSAHHTLPGDIQARTNPPHLDPESDPALTDLQRDDRILARSETGTAVISVPTMATPSTEDGVPLFTEISTRTDPKTVEEISTCLDAVRTFLKPTHGPLDFHYSVCAGAIQSSAQTPQRFIADLQEFPALADEIEARTQRSTQRYIISDVVGSCLWQTHEGIFYLEATRNEGEESYRLHLGLLRFGPPLDASSIISFFDAVAETVPNTQTLWPRRQVIFASNVRPPLSRLEHLSKRLRADFSELDPSLKYVGENPLYGVEPSALLLSDDVPLGLYRPLEGLSTLLYNTTSSEPDTAQQVLKKIVVVELPLDDTLVVMGSVKRGSTMA